jgi:hypothetical protein
MKPSFTCQIKTTAVVLFIFLCATGQAQYTANDHLNTPDPNQTSLYGPDGHPYDNLTASVTNFADVSNMAGSPFFMAEWQKGAAWFKNGKQYKNGDLQFDWVKNELHFQYNGKTCLFADTVAEFLLFDTAGNGKVVDFKNGYPAMGGHNTTTFYQVVKPGAKYQLLVYWTKIEREVYNYGAAYSKMYFKKADWYIYDVKVGKIACVELKLRSVEKAMPGREGEVEKFCGNKKRLTENELETLITSVNGI